MYSKTYQYIRHNTTDHYTVQYTVQHKYTRQEPGTQYNTTAHYTLQFTVQYTVQQASRQDNTPLHKTTQQYKAHATQEK